MSLPYFPMFPSDFEAKTSHLTLEEDGAYNRLLRLSWMTPGCSLPDDPAWIARRMRVDMATFERVVAPIISEFMVREDGRVISPMLLDWIRQRRNEDKRPWIPLSLQASVFERDGVRCTYCGTDEAPFHLDHVHPWTLGGESTLENLTVACAKCNWSKGSKTVSEWRGQ